MFVYEKHLLDRISALESLNSSENRSVLVFNRTRYLLERTDFYVNYAEVKNAGLTGFNFIIVKALIDLYCNDFVNIQDMLTQILLILIGFFYFLSILISLYSFAPNTSSYNSSKNIINFADNAYISDFDAFLGELFFDNEEGNTYTENTPKYIRDCIGEVIINSKIAMKKLKLFKWALSFSILGLFFILVLAIILFVGSLDYIW